MSLSLVVLTEADLPAANELIVEAGWNQVADDWRIFLDLGHVIGLKTDEGRLVATAATIAYGERWGWISMVLVAEDWRRQGLATRLVQRCVAELTGSGIVPLLDATSAGREVYRRMGFRDLETITRWVRDGREGPATDNGVRETSTRVVAVDQVDWRDAVRLDAECFGAERAGLLSRLRDRSADPACAALDSRGRLIGILLGRDGRAATQLGPIVAESPRTGAALLDRAVRSVSGSLIVDLPDRQELIRRWLTEHGFRPRRHFTRMILGDGAADGDVERRLATAGPELG